MNNLQGVLFISVALFFTACSSPDKTASNLSGAPIDVGEDKKESTYLKASETDLRLALQQNPLDSEAHLLLASILAGSGQDDQAIIGYQRAITIDPTLTVAYHNMGTLLLKRGEYITSAELFETAVTNDPDYLPSYNNLGKAYFLAGLPELSVSAYEEVLARDGDNSVAKNNLDLILAAAPPAPVQQQTRRIYEIPDDVKVTFEGENDEPAADKEPSKTDKTSAENKGQPTDLPSVSALNKMLNHLPYISVEDHVGTTALTGWTQNSEERKIVDRILAKWPKILDLSGSDSGDPQRMIEVDAVLFVVTGRETHSVGFNFLRLINLSFTVFSANNADREIPWRGVTTPEVFQNFFQLPSWGSLLTASVDYDVNIANAVDDQVAVLARPHLTTLNGTPAYFLAGGEFVFRVSGIESGDIKPYPFGTSLSVTPTLLRTPGRDGSPRIHIKVEAQRTSVLEFLTAATDDDSIVFDKLSVISQAVLDRGQTLILSGLNQRESRTTDSGVPGLKEVPLVNLFFSEKSTVDENTAVMILLTPRDPAFNDKRNRAALSHFVKKRRAFIEAKQGTKEDMKKFQEEFPHWKNLAPNRFASHFYMLEKSDLYRRVSGEDLIDEDLDLHLLEDHDHTENSPNGLSPSTHSQ